MVKPKAVVAYIPVHSWTKDEIVSNAIFTTTLPLTSRSSYASPKKFSKRM